MNLKPPIETSRGSYPVMHKHILIHNLSLIATLTFKNGSILTNLSLVAFFSRNGL